MFIAMASTIHTHGISLHEISAFDVVGYMDEKKKKNVFFI